MQRSLKKISDKDHAGKELQIATWNKDQYIGYCRDQEQEGILVESWNALADTFAPIISGKKNKGQQIKMFAKEQGIDVDAISKQRKPTVRRRSLKYKNEVAVASLPTKEAVRCKVKEMLASGEINIGEAVVPREARQKKLVGGRVEETTTLISGRKITLEDIRRKTLDQYAPFMRLRTDIEFNQLTTPEIASLYFKYKNTKQEDTREAMLNACKNAERTRSLQMWHDGSSIISHSYMLFMINIIYDDAVFLTDAEWTGRKGVDIQATVETPHIYIIARCRGNGEQLAYSTTRMECLAKLAKPMLINGLEIKDCMRKMIGDTPATAEETGQQQKWPFFLFQLSDACKICDTLASSLTATIDNV